MEVFISAGEVSGDAHAASLLRQAHDEGEKIHWRGIAGPAMRVEGCQVVQRMESLNVMGIGDVLKALPRIRRIEQEVLECCREHRPDVAVLVDFPGFHMRLGQKLRAMGIPVIQYIAPKLWAWGAWRVKRLKTSQDAVASILPFEVEWFAGHGIHAHYVGNPSAITCQHGWDAVKLRRHLGIEPQQLLVGVLPGSRAGELRTHVPILAEVLQQLCQRHANIQFVVPQANSASMQQLAPLQMPNVHFIARDEEDFSLRGVDAAVAVSGTATLELALWDVPTVLIYKAPPLMAFLAKRLVRIRCAGLANILLGDRPVMPELLQEACNSARICEELETLLVQDSAAAAQRKAFAELRHLLGHDNPSAHVLRLIHSLAEPATLT